ncbi:hypothetical protein Tco_0188817 [Tanacetum coccineum]
MNQNFFNSNSFSFDQIQPPQQFDSHQPQEIPEVIPFIESKEWIETKNKLYKMIEAYTERMNQQREHEALLAAQREQELLAQKQAAQEKEEPPQNSNFRQLIEEICGTKVCEEKKQTMEDTMLELLKDCRQKEIYCAHNDVEDLIESALNSKILSIKSKISKSLIHKESIIPLKNTPQISPVNAITHDLPNESLSNEDVPKENFKIYSNPLFDDEEIISTKIDPHSFNAESNLIESFLNRDTLIDSSPKFDYLLEEFSSELAHIDPIPSGINDTDFEPEEEIRLAENLSYDNSSPRQSKEINAEIADMIVESLSPPPILVEDSDSLMEEIDLFLASNDSMPPENDSSNLDHVNDLSSPRPPLKPLDDDIFETEPDTGVLTAKVVGDISEHDVLMPNLLPTQPTLCSVFDPLLSFSSKNKDKVFKPSILTSILLSNLDKITFDFSKIPMMMYGGDIPHLDVLFFYFYPLDSLKYGGTSQAKDSVNKNKRFMGFPKFLKTLVFVVLSIDVFKSSSSLGNSIS